MDSDFTRAVWIPAAQALITGLWAFVAGLSLCALTGWPWYDAGILSGLVSFASWIYFWRWWSVLIRGDLMPRPPEMPQQETLEPVEPQVVKVVIQEGTDTQLIDLPATPEQLQALAQGLSEGKTLTGDSWYGRGKPFSRSQFIDLRDALLRRHLIMPSSPHAVQRGFEITAAMQHLIKRLARPSPTE